MPAAFFCGISRCAAADSGPRKAIVKKRHKKLTIVSFAMEK